jgi:hypothetical protein
VVVRSFKQLHFKAQIHTIDKYEEEECTSRSIDKVLMMQRGSEETRPGGRPRGFFFVVVWIGLVWFGLVCFCQLLVSQ